MAKELRDVRVRPLTLLLILFVLIALGAMAINSMRGEARSLQVTVGDLNYAYAQLEKERAGLSYEVSISDSDEYIIAKARQLYGYMMPNEILFVIKNPEALYGTGETVQMMVLEGDR